MLLMHLAVIPVGVSFLLISQICGKRLSALSYMSVCPSPLPPSAWYNWAPTRGFPGNLIFGYFSKIHQNPTRIKGVLYEDRCTFMVISHLAFLKTINISDSSFTKNRNTHFVPVTLFPKNCDF